MKKAIFEKRMKAIMREQDRNIRFMSQHPYRQTVPENPKDVHHFVVYRVISIYTRNHLVIRFCDSQDPTVKKELLRLADRQHKLVDVFSSTLRLGFNFLNHQDIEFLLDELYT